MKKIKNNLEFYEEIQYLCNKLDELGYEEYKKSIVDSLNISTVPGEIYGNLRNVLDDLSGKNIDSNCQEEIRSLIYYLNNILGSRNN